MPREVGKRMTACGILVVITAMGLVAWVPAGAGAPPPKPLKSGTVRFDDDTANSTDPGGLIPSDRKTIWNPGIPRGIPKVTTIFATIDAATYGNGVTDGRTVINNAIAAAGAVATDIHRQVVYLPEGTYRITGAIGLFCSNVVLRGAGPDKTRIRLDSSTATSVIQLSVPGFWPSYSPAIDVTADAAKGSRQITVADASGIRVGDVLQIDQVDDPRYINRLPDGIYHKRQLNEDVNGPAREAGAGTGVNETGWRSESQQIEVTAKNGTTLRLSGPLHRSFLLRRKPQVFKTATAREGEPGIRYAGVEDLSFSGGGTPGDGQPSVWLLNAAYCWVKNVEGDGRPGTVLPGTYANQGGMTGIHVQLSHAYRCELRHSYLHHARVVRNGGIAYGVSVAGGSSDNLIEDNILINLNKPYLGNNSGGGNVIAYNYQDNAYIDVAPGWQETGLDAAHQAFSHSDLFEGNWATNLSADSTHGNTGFHVFFRNYAHGRNTNPPTPDNANLAAVGLGGYSREQTFIANVLNQTGTGIVYEANPSQNTGVSLPAIYRLGYASLGGNFEAWDDGTAASRIYRHGNWDPVSKTVVWDARNSYRKLPASLFHTSKPSFFGSLDWPWVDPNGSTPAARIKVLPAKQRYDNGTPFATM
jgi:hypothetical protein